MMLFIIAESGLYFNVGLKSTVSLSAGYYEMKCSGARGGSAYDDNILQSQGGAGAYGTFKYSAKDEFEYTIMIGEQGKSNPKGNQPGGWPDGGRSGEDTGSKGDANGGDDGSGSGGGSTRLYINGNLAIVCAGGSGASYNLTGAPGGGFWYNYVVETDDKGKTSKIRKITDTSMTTLGFKGCDGNKSLGTPGAGGGGGYFGGACVTFIESELKWWERGAASGQSFINRSIEGLTVKEFYDGISNKEYIDGMFLISPISCSNGCVKCNEEADKCYECANTFYFENSLCYSCSDNCYKCTNGSSCDKCQNGFFMTQDKKCVEKCPERTYNLNNHFECLPYPDYCAEVDENGVCIKCFDIRKKVVNGKCIYMQTESYQSFVQKITSNRFHER